MHSNNLLSAPKSFIVPESCKIGDFVKIHPGVTLGVNVQIDDFCVIGQPGPMGSGSTLHVPDGSIIRSHSIIYSGSTFGARLETGHHVVIREGTSAGKNLRVGNFSDIEGDCRIGDFCRFHGYVHVGKGSVIGNFVWLFSLVTLTNDPLPPSNVREGVTIEDGVVVCVGCTLMPGSSIGKGTVIAAGCQVKGVQPAAVLVCEGAKQTPLRNLRSLKHKLQFPWTSHFRHAYPKEAQQALEELDADLRLLSSKVKISQ
ncbi:MAG: hypothetical protein MUC83_00090 [Pirellula sp.]|nr:hypothetical protein [Pirellula sp.]